MKKQDYLTESTKQLNEQYKEQCKIDKLQALAQKLVDNIPEDRQQYVLEILTRKFATKQDNVKG